MPKTIIWSILHMKRPWPNSISFLTLYNHVYKNNISTNIRNFRDIKRYRNDKIQSNKIIFYIEIMLSNRLNLNKVFIYKKLFYKHFIKNKV